MTLAMTVAPLLLLLLLSSSLVAADDRQDPLQSFGARVEAALRNRDPPSSPGPEDEVQRLLSSFYESYPRGSFSRAELDLVCVGCTAAVATVVDLFLAGATAEEVEWLGQNLCVLLGVLDREVCRGSLLAYAPQVFSLCLLAFAF